MIGKPRGQGPMFPVYAYDPTIKRKRYIGSYESREVAEEVDREIREINPRSCRRCRSRFLARHRDHWFCSDACERRAGQRTRKRTRYRDDDHWVYTASGEGGDVLYVGMTSTGFRRMREHGQEMEWWPLVARLDVAHFATRQEALDAERDAIARLQPPYNTLGLGSKAAA